MVDLAHHRFLSYEEYPSIDYWERAYADGEAPEMLLALETESGKLKGGRANLRGVLDDASKLHALASRVKVVVFASNNARERMTLRRVAERMQKQDYTRTRIGQAPTWLWLDLPWCQWEGDNVPGGWCGAGGRADTSDLIPDDQMVSPLS